MIQLHDTTCQRKDPRAGVAGPWSWEAFIRIRWQEARHPQGVFHFVDFIVKYDCIYETGKKIASLLMSMIFHPMTTPTLI